ncbi:1-deoxy-D-xylulose-5-phosphate reductoisomerase [Bowmanella sp. JS7-9]|uniref:1-deoxy-D-xylulose 5-phosphate reductoisomerase n=1 Tax=Pseudobowmanella zhangzhouensis TaxID=1537679 RepID=A0ABW1XHU4_9ALTE|nr:1-deoxy-D-xylulose-5-phosphate reductoisomerase [Bowmanella sp. JS7-9]TBX25630.1 1-deoxy-D-xylulose 5-phosphate reductoisomerase [Bowmanella sp. JS7-9]
MQYITVLGATGSIGQSTLDVMARHPDKYQAYALTCHRDVETLVRLAQASQPEHLVVADESQYSRLCELARQANLHAQLHAGESALVTVASAQPVNQVMAAIVGAAGLLPTLAAAQAGKKVLLANKEALVMSGEMFIQAANRSGAVILPIDSEHNAIFQCLPHNYQYGDLETSGISHLLLTGSGGPFRTTPLEQLVSKTPDEACAHPNWSMGRKISVDSATMMNKGLELIEACWLFGVAPEQIEVVLHPQSVIHSMVQYRDGSVLAQLGNPDMRTPIAHAMAYPQRIDAGVAPLNFSQMTNFSFEQPDFQRFPNLRLAIEAAKANQFASTALNAVNEVSVDAFLRGQIAFTQIAQINEAILNCAPSSQLDSIDAVLSYDAEIRALAKQGLKGAA